MYITFNPAFPFLNRIWVGFVALTAFYVSILLVYYIYNKSFPDFVKYSMWFLPLLVISNITNVNKALNNFLSDKSLYVFLFEIFYVFLILKIILKRNIKESTIISLSSVFINMFLSPIFHLFK